MESFYNKHKDELEKLLNNEIIYKPEGERNPDWSRIATLFDKDEKNNLDDYVEDIGNKFIKFAQYVIKNW